LVDTEVNFAFWHKWYRAAIDNRHHTEWLLGEAFFELSDSWIPSCSFNLQSEHICTFFHWWKIWLPIELLEYIRLNIKLVQLGLLLL
jgi:hypothetical protein